jgi:hypothetical protein
MSQLFIQQYLNQLAALRRVSGTTRESVLREAFKDLLKAWGKQHDLIFVPEYKLDTLTRDKRYVDGALLYELRVPFGYWEAKDSNDDLDEEIAKKFKRGYPKDNIVFEDKLGNRSALEWILDQHKEKKPKDPTIREKFDTYRFADYKEKVIDLLMRVTRVSVETHRITEAMRTARR